MIALQLIETNIFMNKLLKEDVFNHFLLKEASISGFASYTINGRINRDFFSSDELEELLAEPIEFLPFSALRQKCFELMKGKRAPLSFRFIFLLYPFQIERIFRTSSSSIDFSNISALFLNISYQEKRLIATTGVSYNTFTVDKSAEQEWDNLVMLFFKENGIVAATI